MVQWFGLLRRGALLGALACLTAVGLAIPRTAAAKPTSLTSCHGIDSAGKYRLDTDVTATSSLACFSIGVGGVTLNLNGHTIAGVQSTFGIDVVGAGANVNIVGPGTVAGFATTGIILGGGNGNVRGVTATHNGTGIILDSAGNSIRGNVATDSGGTDGIVVLSGTGNTIIGNIASGNAANGIDVFSGATENRIIGNVAHNNGAFPDAFDLADTNRSCDSNVWRGNDFGTANQSCID